MRITRETVFATAVVLIVLLTCFGLWMYSMKSEMRRNAETLSEMTRARETDMRDRYILTLKNDSLARENSMMSSHRSLTQMMQYRDEAAKWAVVPEPGTTVAVKPGMDTAVVTGVIAGGTRHEHFVRVKVRYKHGSEESLDPSTIKIITEK
jgi:hypothetical protein